MLPLSIHLIEVQNEVIDLLATYWAKGRVVVLLDSHGTLPAAAFVYAARQAASVFGLRKPIISSVIKKAG
jgi:hypothetical protein